MTDRELQIPQVDPVTKAAKFVYAVEVTVSTEHPDALPISAQIEDFIHASFQHANAIMDHMAAETGWNVAVRVTNEPNVDAVS